ncbi:MAG: 16S rRNA (guanine(966)-N(2))-methyltransferase RsmD [Marinovum sp.]|nr:16S rRNA (guanine(966)-N(2))-methyltransferase RsmD [Marinovum sp.]
MRIVAGRFRGRALGAVGKGDPAAHLRPTTDRVREALFNVLAGGRFGDPFEGPVLDLFAGTGALGLEALSRGAGPVTFVENGRKSLQLLKANIALFQAQSETTVIARDATRLGSCVMAPASLVFLDPPYGKGLGAKALSPAHTQGWIAPGAVIVWEEASKQEAPEGFRFLEDRRYGDTCVTLLEAN